MQIRHQVGDLVDGELVLKAGHLGAAHLDDVDHSLVVRGDAAGHVLLFKKPLQAWTAQVARDVSVMALRTARFVDAPPARLLGIESQFCVALSRLGLAAKKASQKNSCKDEKNPTHRQLRNQPNLPSEIGRTRVRGRWCGCDGGRIHPV